jgi:FKBP-type peptidyl-prolyl cis-trans isomerase FklB
MKFRTTIALAWLLWAGAAGVQAADPPATDLKDLKSKVSYSIGLNIGKSMKADELDIDVELLAKGIRDALAGKSALTEEQVAETMKAFQQQMLAKQAEAVKGVGDKHKTEGATFLAANKQKPGVVTTPSGLQYKIIKSGSGKTPKATDTVTTHYAGRFLDGKEFDSSIKRGQPASFPVNGVIKGWTEALQLMKVGDKWELYVPGDLAYGDEGRPPAIPPSATLVFEVELLEVNAK